MKTYMLSGLVTVEVTTRVRARSLEEAICIAGKRAEALLAGAVFVSAREQAKARIAKRAASQ